MKWTYIIKQKMKAAIVLMVMLALVFMINRIDSRNFSELGNSFVAVYEDRLMAENYLHRLTSLLDEKHNVNLKFKTSPFDKENLGIDREIEAIVADYDKTKLTEAEALEFDDFKRNLADLERLEHSYIDNVLIDTMNPNIQHKYKELSDNLMMLSQVQILEGKKLLDNSARIITSSEMVSKLEIVLLIIVALFALTLILASKSTQPKFSQISALN
ncbi:MAG: hypothetical protein RJQ09_10510 [Cyclobacteriaceae bacterium]